MNLKKNVLNVIIYFSLICAAFLVASLGMSGSRSIWEGYDLVLASSKVKEAELLEVLTRILHPRELVASSRTFVEVNGFSGFERVPLNEVSSRFDPADPRLDPYITGLSRYFLTPGGWQVIYYKPGVTSLALFRGLLQLQEIFPGELVIPAFDPLEKGLVLIFLGGMVLFLLGMDEWKGFRFAGFLLLIPWVPYILSGSLYRFAALYLLYPLSLLFFKELILYFENTLVFNWKRRGGLVWKGSFFLGALLLTGALAMRLELDSFPFFSLLGEVFAGAGFLYFYLSRRKGRSHRLFRRIPLGKRKKAVPVKNLVFIGTLVLVISFIPFYYHNKSQIIDISIPAPVKEMSLAVQLEKEGRLLPGVEDFLKHKAFQEAMPYGGHFGDYSVRLESFNFHQGHISRKEINALSFNDEWRKKVFAQAGRNSVEKMLLSQGEGNAIAFQPLTVFLKKRYVIGRDVIYLSLIILPLLFLHFKSRPSSFKLVPGKPGGHKSKSVAYS